MTKRLNEADTTRQHLYIALAFQTLVLSREDLHSPDMAKRTVKLAQQISDFCHLYAPDTKDMPVVRLVNETGTEEIDALIEKLVQDRRDNKEVVLAQDHETRLKIYDRLQHRSMRRVNRLLFAGITEEMLYKHILSQIDADIEDRGGAVMTRRDEKTLFLALAFITIMLKEKTSPSQDTEKVFSLARLLGEFCAEAAPDAFSQTESHDLSEVDQIISRHIADLRQRQETRLPEGKENLSKLYERLLQRKAHRVVLEAQQEETEATLADLVLTYLDEEIEYQARLS